MCSLTLTNTLAKQLESLGGNRTRVQNLMERRAFDANINQPGLYDKPNTYLRNGFADDLRDAGVRKERIMNHRVYFIGNHFDCNYKTFFIKLNKKGDNPNQDDNNPKFHEILRKALAGETVEVIEDPAQISVVQEETSSWKDADWYKKYGE